MLSTLFQRSKLSHTCCAAGIALLLSLATIGSAPAQNAAVKPATTGQQTYKSRCASCHGAKGEGTKIRPSPLTGDRSVGDLSRYIAQSMPPGPKKCGVEDAKKVAAYIYNAFYSPVSQARSVPARVALSRLTVRQFRSAVADLIGSFRDPTAIEAQRGLRAEYFKAKRFDNGERVLQRVDPEVHFDFGRTGPVPDRFEPHQFSIRWQGSVMAPETGEYEFILHSEHAVRLWVNDTEQPLIDAWVKSGNDNEFHASLTLLGGRAYPLRLEFTKSTQGVDDTEAKKGKPAAQASIALNWKRPHQAEETIPNRCLLPSASPETYVPSTPFPPDDRSIGYERGTSVSKAWDEATTTAALEAAAYVAAHLRELSNVKDNAPDRDARLQKFCRQFVTCALRRPLTEEIARLYVEHQFKLAPDPTNAVKRVVVLTLKSPRFLYQEVDSPTPDAYDTASRLSFALWDSLPDTELLKAAAAGELVSRDQIRRQAERMASDPRAALKVHDFLMQWLKVDQYPDLAKNAKRYPGFDSSVATDLRTSLELQLENTVWSDKSDYRELMLSKKMFLNGRLAPFYGVSLPPDAPFQSVVLDPAERSGVLTHPYILASFAYVDNSSPIHRGVMIVRNMLGRVLKPPPAAFAPLAADLHPSLTTRQRVEMQTRPAACSGCHGMINPLGFTLERFDAIGRLRKEENGQSVNCTGGYQPRSGPAAQFNGAQDLARYIAGSDEAHAAFAEKMFQNLVKQPIRAYGPQALPDLQRSFAAQEYNIRKLLIEIGTMAALRQQTGSSLAAHSGGLNVAYRNTRRDFLRDLGVSAAALPFITNLPCLASPVETKRKQRLIVMFSPDGIVPKTFWPDEEGANFTFKESLKPLEPFRNRTLTLHGVCDRIRGDGDGHMRGIGCLLTGTELFPGNVQGGSDTPAGWSSGISIDQEIKNFLQKDPATRTRFGSLEFGVLVPDRADTWTRMSYAGPNKPLAPVSDPYQMFGKMYGRLKDQEMLKSVLDDLSEDLNKVRSKVGVQDRQILDEQATLVREMETEIRMASSRPEVAHAVPVLEPGVKQDNDKMPVISKLQIDLLVNSFAGDYARVATLQYTNSVGGARHRWLGIEEGQHDLSHKPDNDADAQDKLTRINKWYCEQLAYLAKRLAETPEPGGHGSLLDNTLIVWTNELGQGNTHTLDNIPFVLVGNGLDFQMGRSLKYPRQPHNRLLLSLAHGMGHSLPRFGNPDYCGDGPLPGLT